MQAFRVSVPDELRFELQTPEKRQTEQVTIAICESNGNAAKRVLGNGKHQADILT